MTTDVFRQSLLTLTLVASAAIPCFSQTPPAQAGLQVYPAEMAVEFNTIPGKLVMLEDVLVFVDDQHLQDSFMLSRRILKDVTGEGQVLTISTSEPVRDRLGSRSRVSLRLADAAAVGQVIAWKNQKAGVPSAAEKAPGAPADVNLQLQARHKHFPAGGCSGRLMLTKDRVMYESVTDVAHSRRWDLGQIKQTKRNSPYTLEIEPFDGGSYNFELQGQGLDDRDYRALVDRITSARAIK